MTIRLLLFIRISLACVMRSKLLRFVVILIGRCRVPMGIMYGLGCGTSERLGAA